MTRQRRFLSLAIAIGLVGTMTEVVAQDYPDRPVKVIAQGAAGSGPDVITRIVFDAMGRLWKQQAVILNVPGAGGSTAARQAASSPPDGYTLYTPAASAFIAMREMFPSLPFDMDTGFEHIGLLGEQPMVIAVHPDLGVNSLADLIALSKTKKGSLNYAGGLRGTLPHLTAERFKMATGADLTYIPYQGATAGLQDVLAGRVSMIVEGLGTLAGNINAGTLKALAVTSTERLPEFPDIPTVSETVPGFTAAGWFALVAPKGTDSSIVIKVNQTLAEALSDATLRDTFKKLAIYKRVMSPEQMKEFIRSEREIWKPAVERAGLAAN